MMFWEHRVVARAALEEALSRALRGLVASGQIVDLDALVAAGLAKSKSEARSFIQSGSVTINGAKADALDHQIVGEERLYGRFTILRRGKKNYGLVRWQ